MTEWTERHQRARQWMQTHDAPEPALCWYVCGTTRLEDVPADTLGELSAACRWWTETGRPKLFDPAAATLDPDTARRLQRTITDLGLRRSLGPKHAEQAEAAICAQAAGRPATPTSLTRTEHTRAARIVADIAAGLLEWRTDVGAWAPTQLTLTGTETAA
jgi:hypothetical protein